MIKASAPASISNIACGFDVLGIAVHGPSDEVTAQLSEQKVISITVHNEQGFSLPAKTASNTASLAVQYLLADLRETVGIQLDLYKKMPLGSGLGSSAASAAAAVVAVNQLLGSPYKKHELAFFAACGEEAASGSRHADNAAPSVMGGIVLIHQMQPFNALSLPVPDGLHIAIVHPQVEIFTKASRNLLPTTYPRSTVVQQTAHIAAFVKALYTSDYDLLQRSMVDLIAEPYRAATIPHYPQAKQAAMKAGAIACNISGSGPSMFAFATSEAKAKIIATAMQQVFLNEKIACNQLVSAVNTDGTVIINS